MIKIAVFALLFAFVAKASAQIIDVEKESQALKQDSSFLEYQKHWNNYRDTCQMWAAYTGENCQDYQHRWTLRWDSPRNFSLWSANGGGNACTMMEKDFVLPLAPSRYSVYFHQFGRYVWVRKSLIASRYECVDYIFERK